MNKFKIGLTLILCVTMLGLHAQKIKISEAQGKGFSEGNLGVVGTTDDGFYVLRVNSSNLAALGILQSGQSTIYVDKYTNRNLRRVKTAHIEGITLGVAGRVKGSSYEFALQDSDNNLYVYFSEYVKGINSLYSLRLDTKSFEFVDEKLIYQDKEANKRLDRRATYAVVESEDRSKFSIYSFVNERFTRSSHIYVETFSRDMNSEWIKYEIVQGTQQGNNKTPAFGVSTNSSVGNTTFSISLSNNGIINIMQRNFEDNLANVFGSGKYFHEIYTLSPDSKKMKSKIFENEDKYIVEAMIRHDQNDNISLVGFVGDREGLIDGVILRTMDPMSLKTETQKVVAFSADQKKRFLISQGNKSNRSNKSDKRTARRIDKGKRVNISARNNIINAYVHEDNSITIASEYFDIVTTSRPSSPGTVNQMQQETYYIFGDMKFVNVGADGDIKWVKNIHKYQRSGSMGLLSVSELFLDDEIKFIYNDFQERKLMMISLDHNGNYRPYEIADLGRRGELDGHWFVPSSVKYLSESTIVGFANKLLKTKIIKIDL